MFTSLIVQPLFNLLVLIYALVPGHNFGLALILFTIAIRLLMWPLVRKQMHQVKKMRSIQPELKRIKQVAGNDKRKEQLMILELYKERGINPFGQLGIMFIQIPILLGLYAGLRRVLTDPEAIVTFAYPFVQNLGWLKDLAANIKLFDETLFGIVDLGRSAVSQSGVYWPALLIVSASAVTQYYQSKQLSPDDGKARRLKDILKDAQGGTQADQTELNAAMSRNMRFVLPVMVLMFTVQLASALSLYWFVSGLVALFQQQILLKEDTAELDAAADKAAAREKNALEAEIVRTPDPSGRKKAAGRKKRRR